MTDPVTVQLRDALAATSSQHPEAFASFGAVPDVDDAFDAAAADAGNEHGFTGAHPSLASAGADTITEVSTTALPAPAAALRVGADLAAATLEPGVVYAYPVSVASAFTRRRARLTLTDTALVAPVEPGRVAVLDDALRTAIEHALAEAGTPVGEGEVIESVDIVRNRGRFKPIAEVFRGKSVSTFALLDPATDTLVAKGFANAGAARREAVALGKAGPLSSAGPDPELGELEVVKITGREDGRPLIAIRRERVKAAVVVKVVLVSEKNAAKTKLAGWIFAGTDPRTDAVESTEDLVDSSEDVDDPQE